MALEIWFNVINQATESVKYRNARININNKTKPTASNFCCDAL